MALSRARHTLNAFEKQCTHPEVVLKESHLLLLLVFPDLQLPVKEMERKEILNINKLELYFFHHNVNGCKSDLGKVMGNREFQHFSTFWMCTPRVSCDVKIFAKLSRNNLLCELTSQRPQRPVWEGSFPRETWGGLNQSLQRLKREEG